IKVKGSKFYGLLFNINTEEDVKKYIKQSQELYPQATHYCYAFRLGIEGEVYRTCDDGEPSGTAGSPIYNQLLSSELTHVLLIVVRYFGGIKLGAGGLIKAYKESARFTIEQTEIITKEVSELYQLSFDYSYQSSVLTLLKKLNLDVQSFNSSETCKVLIKIPMNKKEPFFKKFDSLFAQNFVTQKKVS
ncbi:MAG: YigZ family protein, partial [Flavobacteriaceae bacterium]|nr:YigZ family protein [Flavobacteriaceae bacterium]